MSDAAIFSGIGGFLFFIAILVALFRVKCIRVDIWQIRKDVSDIRDMLAKESKFPPAQRDFLSPDNAASVVSSTDASSPITHVDGQRINQISTEGKKWKL
jgi:hypothetical protein